MVELSVEKINAASPYKVTKTSKTNYITFVTEHGIRYVVGFELTEVFTRAEAYQFYITNITHKKSPRDVKLKETIMAVVANFFQAKTLTLYSLNK